MRVTLGERLGIKPPKHLTAVPKHISDDPYPSDEPPVWIKLNGVSLVGLPSAKPVLFESIPEVIDDYGPARVRGEMVWLHKTAPTLVIEGRQGLTPEEHAAGRRR